MIRLSIIIVFLFCNTIAWAEFGDTLKIKKKFNTVLIYKGGEITFSKVKTPHQETFQKRIGDTLFYKITKDIFGIWLDGYDEVILAKKNGQCLLKLNHSGLTNASYSPSGMPKKYLLLYDIDAKVGEKWLSENLFNCLECTITFEGKTLDVQTNEYLFIFQFSGNFATHSDHVNRFYVSRKKGIVRLDYNELYGGKEGENAVSVSDDYVKRNKLKMYIKNTL